MIVLPILFCVVLILFGVLLDFLARKNGYKYQTDQSSKRSNDSEMIKQVHLNQAIGISDSANP
jgi:uncharacterized membrane protein